MKIFQTFGSGLVLILAFTVSAIAQTEKEQSAVSNKVAFVTSETFEDKEKGIKELVDAYAKLSDEFKPQTDEINSLVRRYLELIEEIEKLDNLSKNSTGICFDYSEIRKKIKELQSLEGQIKKLQETARTLFVKRESQVINPIKNKIQEAMKQFAKEKDYEKIIDLSKLPTGFFSFIPIDKNIVDVTAEFIKYYNSLAAKQQ